MKLHLSRKLVLVLALSGGALLLAWLLSTQGPLAPTKVTLAKVQQGPLVASTFGIGTIEARRSYALGPTLASRVARVLVDQGDTVKAGQLLAEFDPADLEDRVASGQFAAERAAGTIQAVEAQLAETQSRAQVAAASAQRFADLRAQGFVSQEASAAKGHEANAAKAAVDARRGKVFTKIANEKAQFESTFMISALKRDGVADLKAWLAERMPPSPWLYPPDQMSDAPLRQLAAEITREKLFERLHQELPYHSTVETEQWKELRGGKIRVEQTIYVERESQRKIVLGKGGATIKAIGEASRRELAEIVEGKVDLFLFVKVREGWGDDPERYRAMGLEFPKE